MVRAARLVVDTGLHSLGWSKDKAVKYLMENTALTKETAELQINQYLYSKLTRIFKIQLKKNPRYDM